MVISQVQGWSLKQKLEEWEAKLIIFNLKEVGDLVAKSCPTLVTP